MTRATRAAAFALGLLALGAGCSGEGAGTPRRETLPILAEVPEFEGELPFADVAPTEWDEAIVHDDGRIVTITYLGGTPSCFGADHVEAVYEENRVILTVHDGRIALGPNEGCVLIGLTHRVTVRLSQPVLNRELVDGAPGRNGP